MSQQQLDVILADLKRIAGAFVLTENNLGDECVAIAADSVRANLAAESDDDGNLWPALSPAYEAWKFEQVGVKPMAELYDVMTAPAEVAGGRIIAEYAANYEFGVSDEAQEEASWFQEGRPPGQPPRPFVGLNAAAIAKLDDLFDEEFRRAVEG